MSFHTERTVKAVRKQHRCEICHKPIEIGTAAVRWAGMSDGQFDSLIWHVDCREAEIAWNREINSPYDDWSRLEEIEWDSHPWMLEKFPAVAAKMGVTQERYELIAKEQEECRLAFARIDEAKRKTPAHPKDAS